MTVRSLTPGEIALLQTVYKDSIDYTKVRISDARLFPGFIQKEGRVMAGHNTLSFPGDRYRDDFSKDTTAIEKSLLVHEVFHVYQHQNKILNTYGAYLSELLRHPRDISQAYAYTLEKGKDLLDYRLEQQATIIQDYYLITQGGIDNYSHRNARQNTETGSALTALFESVLENFNRDPDYKTPAHIKQNRTAPATVHYPLVIISDLHLGMTNKSTYMLQEFLEHVTCDTLILNGDTIDGIRMNRRPDRPFPEAQARVLDAINKKVADGTKVVCLAGNHDTEFRGDQILGKNFFGIEFKNEIDFTDPSGRRLLITHGDLVGAKIFNFEETSVADIIIDRLYVAANKFSARVDAVTESVFKKQFKLVSRLRHAIGRVSGKRDYYTQKTTRHAQDTGYGGIVCGHFHMPENRTTPSGTLYLNSGDWIENHTALALTSSGDWKSLKWSDDRQSNTVVRHFNDVAEKNIHQAYRPITEKMVAAIKNIWPGMPASIKNAPSIK